MIVGFTGTRDGLTRAQRSTLRSVLRALASRDAELHHGDCVGGDEAAFEIVREDTAPWRVHAHPGDSPDALRAHTDSDEIHEQRPNRRRNHVIVSACDVLVACPSDVEERQRRSGTWATVRLARVLHKPVIVVRPDGGIDREGGTTWEI